MLVENYLLVANSTWLLLYISY